MSLLVYKIWSSRANSQESLRARIAADDAPTLAQTVFPSLPPYFLPSPSVPRSPLLSLPPSLRSRSTYLVLALSRQSPLLSRPGPADGSPTAASWGPAGALGASDRAPASVYDDSIIVYHRPRPAEALRLTARDVTIHDL